jgi:modification methylase scrFIB
MVHLKVFEAFAGLGSQHMALRNLGVDYEVVGVSEIDKFAHQSYEAIHGETKNFGDISKLQPEDLPDFDLFTYSFPCFTGDSLVFVKDKGYVPIKNVVVGDSVLTHTGEYKEVTAFYNQGLKSLFSVRSELTRGISTTENHPFYIRSKAVDGLSSPQWKEARELTTSDYLGFPINTESQLPQGYPSLESHFENLAFWHLLGVLMVYPFTLKGEELILKVDNKHYHLLRDLTEGLFDTTSRELGNSQLEFRIRNCALVNYLRESTIKRHRLHFQAHWIDLPLQQIRALLWGFQSVSGQTIEFTSALFLTGKELFYGLSQLVLKAYKVPFKVVESENNHYTITFSELETKSDTMIFEDNYVWVSVDSASYTSYKASVYDISVKDNHSFTVQNCIVHNCTDLSFAGKQQGFEKGSGTSSSLLWECQRLIEGKRPKALLLENVKALNSAKFRGGFHSWLSFLRGLGYTNYYGILNAKDFGLPQNRERVFVVSILGEHKPYRFPNGYDDGSTMSSLLGSDLDTKKWHKQYNIDRFTYELRDKGIVHYLGRFNVPVDYMIDKLKEQGLEEVDLSTIKKSIGMRTQCLFPTGKVSCMLASDYKYPKTVVEGVGCEVPSKLYPSDANNPLARPFVEYERGLSSTREELAKDPSVLWLSEKTANKPQGFFNLALMLSDNQTEEQKPLNGFYSMRYLTPGECWKFMGFSYEDYQKAKAVGLSDLQLYKQAGNSIAVPCLEALFKGIYDSLEYIEK